MSRIKTLITVCTALYMCVIAFMGRLLTTICFQCSEHCFLRVLLFHIADDVLLLRMKSIRPPGSKVRHLYVMSDQQQELLHTLARNLLTITLVMRISLAKLSCL
jgi:hypothetical protein